MKKKVLSILLSVACVFSLAACNTAGSSASKPEAAPSETVTRQSESTGADTEPPSDGPYETTTKGSALDGSGLLIGCIFINVENSIYANMKNDMEQQSGVWGNEFMFVTAEEAAEQISAVENMMDAGCNAIIVHISNAEAIESTLQNAVDRGVNVLAFDGQSPSAVKSYVADNYNSGYNTGKMTGEWINANLNGKAKVGLFTYTKMEVLVERDKGLRDGLAATAPGAEITIDSEDYTISMGVNGAENFLQAVPDLDVLMSFNGSAALGGYQTFQATGINDDKHAIFAVDGAPEEFTAIAEGGCYRGTTSMGFNDLGYLMLGDAIKACLGMDTGEEVSLWPVATVTQENVQDFIK